MKKNKVFSFYDEIPLRKVNLPEFFIWVKPKERTWIMSDVKIPEDIYKLLETVFTESSAIYFEKSDRDKLREFFAHKKAARMHREEYRKEYKARMLK